MKPYKVYYHINMLDCALEILSVQYKGPNYIKVKANLHNRHTGVWYERKTYKIQRKDLKYWLEQV